MQRVIESRGIQHLVHFTRVRNLPSLLDHGLLGRSTIQQRGIDAIINDQYRFDYLPNAICCSISFPNYRLFYRMRCDHTEDDWAVIRLRPDILWSKRCVFCTTNAATKELAEIDVRDRMNEVALKAMFAEMEGRPTRADLGIPAHYPTDPQAEVLVLDPIEQDMIIDILIDREGRLKNRDQLAAIVKPYMGKFQFYHAGSYFYPRSDYQHWQSIQNG